MVEVVGIEPTCTSATDLQSAVPPLEHHPRKTGSRGRDRTCDQLINSQLHYRCATLELNLKNLVAVAGIEHGLEAYETSVPPIHYPAIKLWSRRQGSNLRPSGPKPDALPDCATPRKLWCPLTESNCQPRITKPVLCHLTKRAKLSFYDLYSILQEQKIPF